MSAPTLLGAERYDAAGDDRPLPPISLDELTARSALLTRSERKYVVDAAVATTLLAAAAAERARVLTIEGATWFRYRSVYFDTPERQLFGDAAHRRPMRTKVRTRSYLDGGGCWLEVKRRDRLGTTAKSRRPHDGRAADTIDAAERPFIDAAADKPGLAGRLVPTLTTSYRRRTLGWADERVTFDADVELVAADGARAHLARRVIIETKTTGGPGAADRLLWRLGVRPQRWSKYGVGLAALDPTLPDNAWHRSIARFVRVQPRADRTASS
ncbi:MAG: polyphosphate polymerase domain-containing protein [Desertimonas sp.]